VYDDGGSGARLDGSFWKPNQDVIPDGFYYLGHLAIAEHNPPVFPKSVIVKANERSALKRPTGFEWVYDDYKTGARMDMTIYRPVPPAGYSCLGLVAFPWLPKNNKPTVESFPLLRCVRNDLVTQGAIGMQMWNDVKSGGRHDFSAWNVVAGHPSSELEVGAFTGHRSYTVPSAADTFVLKRCAMTLDKSIGL
jgi:Vacuolar protein sorting-associated protein 62